MTRQLSIRTADFPDIHKFTVGFDKFFDEVHQRHVHSDNYPPHNLIRESDDKFLVELAVAGFSQDEISVTVERQILSVTGTQAETETPIEYIHRGISGRNFVRSWTLADHVEVTGASFDNGILKIALERKIPEEQKPRQIAITKK